MKNLDISNETTSAFAWLLSDGFELVSADAVSVVFENVEVCCGKPPAPARTPRCASIGALLI